MGNWEPGAARDYHEGTKHSFRSVRASAHFLDWDNRPNPFKDYMGTDAIPLPTELPESETAALDALAAPAEPPSAPLGLVELARLLRWGAGVVRTRMLPGDLTYYFRTYSSAGALYPVEVYVACAELPGLAAGLYHFHPRDFALRPLRAGDLRRELTAAADATPLAEAGAVLLLTGILWRSAWKYQARAYRHLYWDAGTMLANLLALSASMRLGPRLLTGFVDAGANRLLGIDGQREAALALLAVGQAQSATPHGELEPLELEVAPLSRHEVSYPQAYALHAASSLATVEEIRRYRAPAESSDPTRPGQTTAGAAEPLEKILRRRGSVREFTPEAVAQSALAAILARAAAPIPSDVPPLNEIYLIANAVEGLAPGTYRFTPPDSFELLRQGNFRAQAGYLALEQELGSRAAATLFLLADLDRVLGALGNRGYRAAQLEAGIRVGRVYLGAYAQGMAATASTFYDDDVTGLLAPGTSMSPMLCVAVGFGERPRSRGGS